MYSCADMTALWLCKGASGGLKGILFGGGSGPVFGWLYAGFIFAIADGSNTFLRICRASFILRAGGLACLVSMIRSVLGFLASCILGLIWQLILYDLKFP